MKLRRNRIIAFLILCFTLLTTVIGPAPAFAASSPISNVSYEQNTDGSITVFYYLSRNLVTSGLNAETSQIGYDYPAEYRTTGKYYNTATTQGWWTQTLPKPAINGRIKMNVKYQVYTYQETNYQGDLFSAPYWKSATTNFHTVTTSEAIAGYIVVNVAPGLATTIFSKNGYVKIAGQLWDYWQVYSNFAQTVNWPYLPTPVAGQYIKTTQWYESDYTVHTTVGIYTNYESYSKGVSPIFSNSWTYRF